MHEIFTENENLDPLLSNKKKFSTKDPFVTKWRPFEVWAKSAKIGENTPFHLRRPAGGPEVEISPISPKLQKAAISSQMGLWY